MAVTGLVATAGTSVPTIVTTTTSNTAKALGRFQTQHPWVHNRLFTRTYV